MPRSRSALEAVLRRLAPARLTGPFEELVGYEIGWDDEAGVVVQLDIEHQHTSHYGVAHGGVTLVLLDTVGGVAAALETSDLARIATISLSANFIRAVQPGRVVATARIDHQGRSVAHVMMQLHEGTVDGPLLATAHAAYRLFRIDS